MLENIVKDFLSQEGGAAVDETVLQYLCGILDEPENADIEELDDIVMGFVEGWGEKEPAVRRASLEALLRAAQGERAQASAIFWQQLVLTVHFSNQISSLAGLRDSCRGTVSFQARARPGFQGHVPQYAGGGAARGGATAPSGSWTGLPTLLPA